MILKNPTEQEYDALDRVIETKLPAKQGEPRPAQTTEHQLRGSVRWVRNTDPMGNVSEQKIDGRGNIIQVIQLGKGTEPLTKASYTYNALCAIRPKGK